MIIRPKKEEKKDISDALNKLPIIEILSMNDLYYRYNHTKTVNKYFEQLIKVLELMKLYQEAEDRILLSRIVRLCFAQSNTLIISHLKDKQVMKVIVDTLLSNDRYKVGNTTAIIYHFYQIYKNEFYQVIPEIPESFSKVIYFFDQLSIYQLFYSLFNDSKTDLSSFSFIYYWIFGFSKSSSFSASVTKSMYETDAWKDINQEILEEYTKNLDFNQFVNEKPFAFINFIRSLSLLCKNSVNKPEFKQYIDLIMASSQFFFCPFFKIVKPNSEHRGTIKDDCVSSLLELYSYLPREKNVYFNCIDILRNHFYGSRLNVLAINYITNNIKNPAMNSYDFDLFSITVPFRIYYINEDYLYFINYDDPIKSRLIFETKPNNITMEAGISYIKSLIRASGSQIHKTRNNLVRVVLVLWYNSVNCVDERPDAKLIQTFLLRICILIGDDYKNAIYHKLYQNIAIPFFNSIYSDKNEVSKSIAIVANNAEVKSNNGFIKRWEEMKFELDEDLMAFFDKMIEELDRYLLDSSFNFETDFDFPKEEEEEEEEDENKTGA